MLWMSGAPTFGAFLEWAKAYTLEGLEKEITCPTLCMTARGEGTFSMNQVQKFYAALQCPKRLITLLAADDADSRCGLGFAR